MAAIIWINGAYCAAHRDEVLQRGGPGASVIADGEPTNYSPEVIAAYEQGRSDAALALSELCLQFEDRKVPIT